MTTLKTALDTGSREYAQAAEAMTVKLAEVDAARPAADADGCQVGQAG